jgi:hypothetical protein
VAARFGVRQSDYRFDRFGVQLMRVLLCLALMAGPVMGSYSSRRAVVIDHTKVANTDQVNFPLAFSGTYTFLKSVGNGGGVQNANGYDIAFFSDSGLTTALDCEQVYWSASTGQVEFHVRIPTLSHTTNTTIYIGFGDSGVSTAQCASTGTWNSAYKLVWHLPNGSSLTANDSTANGNSSTLISGGVAASTFTLDGAASWGSVNNSSYISSNFTMPTTNFTYSVWIQSSGSGVYNRPVGAGDYTGGTFGTSIVWNLSSNTSVVFRQGSNTGVGDCTYVPSGGFTVPHYLVVTRDSTNGAVIYDNGVSVCTNSTYKSITTGGNHVWLGRDQNQNSNGYLGAIDEFRVSNTVRSADWIATEYNNQSSPSTFYSVIATGGNLAFPILY